MFHVPGEQFNALTNLHNETLARIMERHSAVRDRLSAWDNYRADQTKLLAWLKDIERERGRLQLRFIHLRRLDKILQKIQALIDKIPVGEDQLKSLESQQETLLSVNCDEALTVSVRMEHAANAQRLASIRASLETWRDFVTRIKELNARHTSESAKISDNLQDISEALSHGFHAVPVTSLALIRQQLDSLQHLKMRLQEGARDLESFDVITEQLKECLSPSDMKSLKQHGTLLWQTHGDLEHQLALLAYKLGERQGQHSRWESRLSRFMTWMRDVETRIQNSDDVALDEPEEALKRLECELRVEMALKQKELEWLRSTGLELAKVAEESDRTKLEKSLDEVEEKWKQMASTGKAKANKIMDLMRMIGSLENRIGEIKSWLGKVESQLAEPFTIECLDQNAFDEKMRAHEQLQRSIEAESANVGEVLNLCEILLNDCDSWKATFGTDILRNGMENLERRWKGACLRSAERKSKILLAWKFLQELDADLHECEAFVVGVEDRLKELENRMNDSTKEESLNAGEKLLKDIEDPKFNMNKFEQNYGSLAKSGLEIDNLRALTMNVKDLIDRWHASTSRISTILNTLHQEDTFYREFISAHEDAVTGLTQVDVLLTQAEHLMNGQSPPEKRMEQLIEIEKELATLNESLQHADELALKVMEESHEDDVSRTQELVDEYQMLWRDIRDRVVVFKTEIERKTEVDEAVQVETLKFEQDTAVQVDTLPMVERMTSLDAYLIELKTAMNECQNALDSLERVVTPEPVPGPALPDLAKNIVSLHEFKLFMRYLLFLEAFFLLSKNN